MDQDRQLEESRIAGREKWWRSTPLRPAVWMTSVLAWATVVALIMRVPTWGSVFFCAVTGASFVHYLVTYVYLVVTDRDTLRAERYSATRAEGAVSSRPPNALGELPEPSAESYAGADSSAARQSTVLYSLDTASHSEAELSHTPEPARRSSSVRETAR